MEEIQQENQIVQKEEIISFDSFISIVLIFIGTVLLISKSIKLFSEKNKFLIASIFLFLIGILLLISFGFSKNDGPLYRGGLFSFFVLTPLGIIFMMFGAGTLNKYFKLSNKNPNIDIVKKGSIVPSIMLIIIGTILTIIYSGNIINIALLIIGIFSLIIIYFKKQKLIKNQ